MTSRRRRLGLLLWVAVGGFVPGAAHAGLLQISFQGVVQEASAGIAGDSFAIGTELGGALTIDTLVPDFDTTPNTGIYLNSVRSFDFFVGTYTGALSGPTNGPNQVIVHDDANSVPSVDTVYARTQFAGAAVNGFAPSLVQFGLTSFDTSLLTNDAIPTASEVNAFASSYNPFVLSFAIFGAERLDWTITSFVAVPEPAALLLVGSSLVLVVAARRRA